MKNKETIYKLFEDNISNIYKNEENEELTKEIMEYENQLLSGLTKEQKELLNIINKLRGKRRDKLDRKIFTYAFSLANRLMIESLKE